MKILFSIREVSDITGVNLHTVYTWTRQKRLKTIKIGGSLRVPRDELEKLIPSKLLKRYLKARGLS